jgi:hypothetical protein
MSYMDNDEKSEKKDVVFLDLFDPRQPRSDQEIVEYRLNICKQCPHFYAKLQKCLKCGCFMKLKTRLHNAHCPIKKW